MSRPSSATPHVKSMQVIPVAGYDSMLLNLCGAHAPYFTRNLVLLTDNAGNTGIGEVPGGEGIRQALERSCPLVIGQPIGAVVGGYVVAFSEVMVTYAYRKVIGYLGPSDWMPDGLMQLLSTDYKFAVSFVILVLVLLVRPPGLFRGRSF